MSLVHIVLVEARLGAGPIVPVGLVHIAFFRADPERRGLIVREVERRNCYFSRLVMSGMDKLERFLRPISAYS